MASLSHRAAAVTLVAAGLLGLAGATATEASATTIRHFVATGRNPGQAGAWAWASAHAAGFTDAQCGEEVEGGAGGYWKAVVTCVVP
ncbi:hypothetical protein GCM10009665_00240 [Kitasatospora nipponensis]|uniref:Uncharacterized protein n=1 Tax=Kitasatospora nipponensis TaxID=258049 RepID=A0ABP4G915_9ACTN